MIVVGVMTAIGIGALVLGLSLPAATSRVVTFGRPIDAAARNLRDIRAHNSPKLGANPLRPQNLALVNRIDTPSFSCALHVSFDDGSHWSRTAIPFPDGEEEPPRCFGPDLAWGADGKLLVSFVTLKGPDNAPHALWLSSSENGGRSLTTPRKVSGALAFQAHVLADPVTAGRVYACWLQAGGITGFGLPALSNPITVTRSDDGGATWKPPVEVNPPSRRRPVAPSMAIGPRGDLDLVYLDLGGDVLDYQGAHEGKGGDPYGGRWSLVLARSADLGATWRETTIDDQLVPIDRLIVFFPPAPSLAVDRRRGLVYVGFHDARRGDADVVVWTSRDGGVTFGPTTRVNDTPVGDGTAQYLPALDVAPNGRLDVVYYDRRADRPNVMTQVSVQSSSDHGRSFSPRLEISGSAFDSGIGFGSERGLPDLGSRLGLLSSDTTARAVWADTRAGTPASNKQDLAEAVVAYATGSPLSWPLVAGGIVLVAGALAYGATTNKARRAP